MENKGSATGTRVSISRKIFLIAASFALPIAVLVYLYIDTINANIAFSVWESKGDTYQRPLEDLLQNVQTAQIAINVEDHAKAKQAQKNVDTAFDELKEVDRFLGNDLQFTAEGLAKRGRDHQNVQAVRKEWDDLTVLLAKPGSGDLNAKFDHITADIRTMITHMGDTSNLILDPDLDSYYLMDVTLLALPQTQDRLAQVVQYGYQVLKRGVVTEEEKIKLAVYAAMLQEADQARIVGDIATVINEDANFYGTSPTLKDNLTTGLKEYSDANGLFVEMTQKLSASNMAELSPEAYLKAGITARDASFKFWRLAVDEEDKLLNFRIASYEQKKMISLALALLAVVIASFMAFSLTRTITRPLTALVVSNLGPGATLLGVCVERISEASKNKFSDPDEARFIIQELTANCNSMRTAVAELESQVTGKASS